MPKPMPITVYGPVTPISPAVKVGGVLPGAQVEVLDNGATTIGEATARTPGELMVPLTSQPTVGHTITAIQKTADGPSEPSAQPIAVVDIPDPLPTPGIACALNTCMSDIAADGLVPGTVVVTVIGGKPFGKTKVSQNRAWLGIDPNQQIPSGSIVEIHQEVQIGTSLKVGPTARSLSIPAFQLSTDFLPPPNLGPLIQCDTSREFLVATPGASTTITNEGQTEAWVNVAGAFHGDGAPPLRKGSAVAVQTLPRCKRQGQPVTLPVAAAENPPPPAVGQDLCPQTLRLQVSNLAPGGILHVSRRVRLDPSGTAWSTQLLGDHGIQNPSESVDLPASIALTDPAGPVFIALSQERCAGLSTDTLVKISPPSGPFPAPRIVEPIFDCSRALRVQGAHPGSLLQAFDSSGTALSDPVVATQPDFLLFLWFPLADGSKVFVRQSGCNADGDSSSVAVRPLPQPLPVPKIIEPIRPEAAWIRMTNIIPGARVYLLVNNQLRPGSVDIYTDPGLLPVTGGPLQEKDRVFLVQQLCDRSSSPEGVSAVVQRGNIKLSGVPASIPRGQPSHLLVTAQDVDTNAPISATLLINGQVVGATGSTFSYTPSASDPSPISLTAQDGAAYFNASAIIALTDAKWLLTLNAGPVPAYLDNIKINIDQLTWTVTPDWDPSQAAIKSITPSPGTATTSVPLPIPTGSTKTVTVTISGNASTVGGDLNGFNVAAQKSQIVSDTKKVAFHGVNETAAWLLSVSYVSDQTSTIYFDVTPTLQGISP